MYYPNPDAWLRAPQKRVVLFGMSGLGKTHVSALLRDEGWFHYSIDYRIGTRYMGEYIADNFKREAMKVPFLAELLRTDSIYVSSNITFENLAPLSSYLGKPGDPTKGGLTIDEYRRRQDQHHRAEVAALLDTGYFIDRARDLYGYDNFICDTGGSICEVVDPGNPDDPVMTHLSSQALPVWIKGSSDHTDELIRRFDRAPKPMCYQAGFLTQAWTDYLDETGETEATVDPDTFVRWTYARAMAHREPIYAAMSDWGVTVTADEMFGVKDPEAFAELVARAIDRRTTTD